MDVCRYPGRLLDLAKVFQRESSRLFGEVIKFIYEEHAHRITAFLVFWEPRFKMMAGVIQDKGDKCIATY